MRTRSDNGKLYTNESPNPVDVGGRESRVENEIVHQELHEEWKETNYRFGKTARIIVGE